MKKGKILKRKIGSKKIMKMKTGKIFRGKNTITFETLINISLQFFNKPIFSFSGGQEKEEKSRGKKGK